MKKFSLNSDQAHKILLPKMFLDPKCGPLMVFVESYVGYGRNPKKERPMVGVMASTFETYIIQTPQPWNSSYANRLLWLYRDKGFRV